VTFDDRHRIITPEGVVLEMGLAGVGSRILAAIVDTVIQYLIILGLVAVAVATGSYVAVTIMVSLSAAFFFGYHIAFEVLNNGRTPGKAAAGVRVVDGEGGPVRLGASFARNLMRLIDMLPGIYLAGLIAVLASPKSQRLGDMVADTLVVYERRQSTRASQPGLALAGGRGAPAPLVVWGRLSAEDLALVHSFLNRRASLPWEHRTRLAGQLRDRLAAKAGVPVGASAHPEAFLEALVAPPPAPEPLGAWDVSAVTADDVAVLQGFLERRHTLEWAARIKLADSLRDRLATRISTPGDLTSMPAEDFLERLYQLKTDSPR